MNLVRKAHILSLIFFFIAILLSVVGINGFLQGHLGWLGPHLYSVSINLENTKFFLADGIYDDGSYHLYNHHPPFFFYVFYLISKLGQNLSDKLQIGYFFAAFIYSLSWIYVYKILKFFGLNSRLIVLSILLVSSATIFTTYRAVLSFDIFSIFISGSMIYAFYIYDNHLYVEKNKIIYALLLCFFSTLISYYSFFIIFVGFVILLIKKLYLKEEIKKIIFFGVINASFFLIALLRIPLTIFFLQDDHSTISNFFSRALGSGMVPNQNIGKFTESFLLEKYVSQIFMLIPDLKFLLTCIFSFLILRLINKKNITRQPEDSIKINNITSKIISVIIPIIGVLFFYIVSPYWTAVHPFAILLLSAPFTFIAYVLIQKIFGNNNRTIIICLIIFTLLSVSNFYNERKNNLTQIKKTFSLISFFDHKFLDNYSFQRFGGTCGKFNGGMFKYLTSFPNKWFSKTSNVTLDKVIKIECVDKKNGNLRLSFANGDEIFYFDGKKGLIIEK